MIMRELKYSYLVVRKEVVTLVNLSILYYWWVAGIYCRYSSTLYGVLTYLTSRLPVIDGCYGRVSIGQITIRYSVQSRTNK